MKKSYEETCYQLCLIFPFHLVQVLSPSIPARKKLKDGRYSDARQRLYPGCLFVRCVLTREVYDVLRSNPRVRDFYGTKANTRSVIAD
jgi:transcription antitermination factor NusG